MKMTGKFLTVASMSVAMFVTSIAPAGAFTVPVPAVRPVQDVEQVQYRRPPPHYRDGWYNGHRGYHDRRPGYRRHSDGYWYPLAAFAMGAIISGAMQQNARPVYGSRHQQWCASRYRTYRASDNTYVPRAGVRAYCNSPYN